MQCYCPTVTHRRAGSRRPALEQSLPLRLVMIRVIRLAASLSKEAEAKFRANEFNTGGASGPRPAAPGAPGRPSTAPCQRPGVSAVRQPLSSHGVSRLCRGACHLRRLGRFPHKSFFFANRSVTFQISKLRLLITHIDIFNTIGNIQRSNLCSLHKLPRNAEAAESAAATLNIPRMQLQSR